LIYQNLAKPCAADNCWQKQHSNQEIVANRNNRINDSNKYMNSNNIINCHRNKEDKNYPPQQSLPRVLFGNSSRMLSATTGASQSAVWEHLPNAIRNNRRCPECCLGPPPECYPQQQALHRVLSGSASRMLSLTPGAAQSAVCERLPNAIRHNRPCSECCLGPPPECYPRQQALHRVLSGGTAR
jgi:hypothetical protein